VSRKPGVSGWTCLGRVRLPEPTESAGDQMPHGYPRARRLQVLLSKSSWADPGAPIDISSPAWIPIVWPPKVFGGSASSITDKFPMISPRRSWPARPGSDRPSLLRAWWATYSWERMVHAGIHHEDFYADLCTNKTACGLSILTAELAGAAICCCATYRRRWRTS
jgi:hypothetical protein